MKHNFPLLTGLAMNLLISTAAFCGNRTIQEGTDSKIIVQVDTQRGTMLLLPRAAKAVTGKTRPAFQVEVYAEKIMVTPLLSGAKTNLFIDLGAKTIITVELIAVNEGGEDLVRFLPQEPESEKVITPLKKIDLPEDFANLSGRWDVKKIGKKSRRGEVTLSADYILRVGGKILVNFSVENRGREAVNITDVSLLLYRMGGFVGTTIADVVTIPASVQVSQSSLGKNEITGGVLYLPTPALNHDQLLGIRITDQDAKTTEVRFEL